MKWFRCREQGAQTRTQWPLFHFRKGIWKGNLKRGKALNWEYITKGFPTIPLKLTTVAQMSLICYNSETFVSSVGQEHRQFETKELLGPP